MKPCYPYMLILSLAICLTVGCMSMPGYKEVSERHHAYASGETLGTLSDWHTLISEYEAVLRMDAQGASADDAQYAIASCWIWCVKAGDPEAAHRAIEAFQKLIRTYPDSPYVPQAYYWLGRSYSHLGDSTRAVQNYQVVTNRYAEADIAEKAQLELGRIYAQQGYVTRAETLYVDIVESAANQEIANAAAAALQALKTTQQNPAAPTAQATAPPQIIGRQQQVTPKQAEKSTQKVEAKPSGTDDKKALIPESLTREFGLTAKTIVIDAGHGGKDPGGSGTGDFIEKPIALSISKKLRDILTPKGYTVLLTRETDRFISLKERTQFAIQHKADLFLSIHANATGNTKVNGIETYYLDINSTDGDSERIAARENANSGYSLQELETLLKGLIQESKSGDSYRLAKEVQRELIAATGAVDRGVKHARFVVLIGTNVPAILIETGFISNSAEVRKLITPAYQQKLAAAIAQGVEKFLEKTAGNRLAEGK